MESPTCTNCYGEHDIYSHADPQSHVYPTRVSATCSDCHASETIVARFGLKADRIKTFKKSFHGVATVIGNRTVANCASCHGYHDILPENNPDSKINPTNVVKTCGASGCHTDISPEGDLQTGQSKKEPERTSCVACHGEGFDLMFDNWKEGSQKVLNQFGRYLKSIDRDFSQLKGSRKARTRVREALRAAQADYDFVRDGHIPHNIRYALSMLNAGADSVENAMHRIRKAYHAPDRGEALNPRNACVTFCHGKYAPPETVIYEGDELPHAFHIEEAELACANCHSVSEHGKTKIDQSVCNECH